MILGIDASTQLEVDAKNPVYRYKGEQVEPWSFLYEHNGVSYMRLRIWLDPYDEEGRPYGGGTNDYAATVKLAKRALKIGYKILIDFHYSDFWCDPSKQCIPKAWKGLSLDEIAVKLHDYTYKTLSDLRKDGVEVSAVQVGNEITNGTLWPLAKLGDPNPNGPRNGYDNLAKVLIAGCSAVHEFDPSIPRVIHLEKSGAKALHEEYFTEITKRGVEFEIIGESFYPYWHGTFEMVFGNIDNLKEKFHKPVWIVETGYGFTLEPYILSENNGANLIDAEFFKQKDTFLLYPLTLEGQRDFIKNLLIHAKEHGVEAVMYWEPLWLPLPGLEWASKVGEEYIHETHKPTHNEWANQCLFDYNGDATPGLDEFKL